jgi:hypothetical protein
MIPWVLEGITKFRGNFPLFAKDTEAEHFDDVYDSAEKPT